MAAFLRKGGVSIVSAGLSLTALRNSSRCLSSSALLLRKRHKFIEKVVVAKEKSKKKVIDVYADMTVRELAEAVEDNVDSVMDVLLSIDPQSGDNLSDEKVLEGELIGRVVSAFRCKHRFVTRPSGKTEEVLDVLPLPPPSESESCPRAPVVTIMGHVDHGKTTLLDCLRRSRIVESEFGGITQHIGAFTLKEGDSSITFLDTPGHAAFADMRRRGASSTDIVVLVVAAEDGVKEQTVESIRYAKEAGVPIIVAINKCDKPEADPAKAKRSLLEHNVVVEDFHGDVLAVEISALYGTNVPALKEAILLQAEDMGLRSTAKGPVEGVVIESMGVQGVGKSCSMIVQRGTLTKGSYLVAGTSWAKVRQMTDENHLEVSEAGPSTPVMVAGWREGLPPPGEFIGQVSSEHLAKQVVARRVADRMKAKAEEDWKATEGVRNEERQKYLANRQKMLDSGRRYGSTLRGVVHKEHRFAKEPESGRPSLKLMMHSDVDGTLEALLNVLDTYNSSKVDLHLVSSAVGAPAAKDIELAAETGAVIYCFNVEAPKAIKNSADEAGVIVQRFNVIYHLVDDLKDRLSSLVPDVIEKRVVARGRVIKEFLVTDRSKKKRPIAGIRVESGAFKKSLHFRFLRDGEAYYDGFVESMQCEDKDISSVQTGQEVGIALPDKALRFKDGDRVEVLEDFPVKQTIDWNPPGF